MIFPCGCINEINPEWSVMQCVHKCAKHVAEREALPAGREYYESLGLFDADGRAINLDNHVRELVEAIGDIPRDSTRNTFALEIGCGVSRYYNHIKESGYVYFGIDNRKWAVDHFTSREGGYRSCAAVADFDEPMSLPDSSFGLILSAHCFEHLKGGPERFTECHRLLRPGGYLILVLPDDTDQVNPDHLWFFNEASLRFSLDKAGFAVEALAVRQIIPKEKFIYCRARKAI